MVWLLLGYMFLFIHRPFEVWPVLGTFHQAPAAVETGPVNPENQLPCLPAHIPDPNGPVPRINANLPWIAKSIGPNLRTRARARDEGIAWGDAVSPDGNSQTRLREGSRWLETEGPEDSLP